MKKGEVFAFKTDTVWGFGAHPDDSCAISNIYKIKHRDLKKPLILMSDNFSNLSKYIKVIPPYACDLIEKYLPGALTLIFKKSDYCSYDVTSNADTIGVRIPNSQDFFNLVAQIEGGVLATTSCNISSEPPVKNYSEAFLKFSDVATIIKPIVDTESENIPSTVVLCLENEYKILRKGAIEL